MRITQAGVYVLIQKYGIEGLLVEDSLVQKIVTETQKEQADLFLKDGSSVKITLFDHLNILIEAKMIEFRRSINLHFLSSLNINTMKGTGIKKMAKEKSENLSQAIKKKKK